MSNAISIDPNILSGTPVFPGSRVPIRALWDFLEDGASIDEFLEAYDWITREQVMAVLEDSFTVLIRTDAA